MSEESKLPDKDGVGDTALTEKIRLVIVCIAAILAILSFVAFIITNDAHVLLSLLYLLIHSSRLLTTISKDLIGKFYW